MGNTNGESDCDNKNDNNQYCTATNLIDVK